MRKLLLAATIGLALCGVAAAQEIGGSYTSEGTNPDGSAYSGTVEITPTSETTCQITWVTGSTTSQGICMRNGNAFSAAYMLDDAVGLLIYLVKEDGSMEGLWTMADKEGSGTENLTPVQ